MRLALLVKLAACACSLLFLVPAFNKAIEGHVHVDLVSGHIEAPWIPGGALNFYHETIRIFSHPASLLDIVKISFSFVVLAIVICTLVECTNPNAFRGAERRKVILEELSFSLKSWSLAPVIALGLLCYAYPARHGHAPPVYPSSIWRFLQECVLWILTFDATQYVSHRTLHIGKFYAAIHKPHHSFPEITAFSAQTNSIADTFFTTLVESMVFLLFPISFATHALLGLMLFTYASFIHDDQDRLDGGFHREHHANPVKNLGFLGLVDLVMGTVYWGPTRDGLPEPLYAEHFDLISRVLMPWRPSPLAAQRAKMKSHKQG